jgi:hypothetical protein
VTDNPLTPDLVDAAKRCSDIVNLHVAAGFGNRGWCAIRLSDGGSDGVVYDTRADAVDHQFHESQCAYIKIPHDGMPLIHAASFLRFTRAAYDAGMRVSDPAGPGLIMPRNLEQIW